MDVAKLLAAAKAKKDAIKSREKTLKPKPGTNNYVILGDWNRERNEVFYREFGNHFVKDAAGDLKAVHLCMAKTYEQDCPVCNVIAEAAKHVTDDSQIKALEEAASKRTYLLNVLELDESGTKHDGQPKILEVGYMVFSGILDLMEDWGEAIFQEHQIITISRDGAGKNTKYNVLPKGTKKAVVSADTLNRLNDLEDYVNQANEEKKRIAMNAVRAVVGLSAPAGEGTHIPATRTIGMSGQDVDATDADFTEVRAAEAARPDLVEIDIDSELEDLLATGS
jgi:hypothetical protein